MRLVSLTSILALALCLRAGSILAQSGPTVPGSTPLAAASLGQEPVTAHPVPPWVRHRSAEDSLGLGPGLPAVVVPATTQVLADQPAAPAPKGNIVIPVTSALIVLAALVVILLID